MKSIDPADLIPMDLFPGDHPIEIDVMYAGPSSFCGPVYRPDARLSLHRDMAEIVLVTAHLVRKRGNATLIPHDGLRTTTVQALICDTPIVKAHPHWTAEGPLRMFAPPGKGGHPRGMAIDVSLRGADGALLDMGTLVDALPEGGADKDHNPAHREYVNLSEDVRRNRDLLTHAFLDAAACFNRPLRPLPSEWWDYRFPDDVYNQYAPLADEDVPHELRLSSVVPPEKGCSSFPLAHYGALADRIARTVAPHIG